MSSGTFIIKSALKRIGAASVVQPAAPETILEGRDILNSMLQMWLTQGIDIGVVPLDSPGEELGEPLDTRNAIIDNLAIMLAPDFDNGTVIVSRDLKGNARSGFAWVKQQYRPAIVPPRQVSSTTAKGQGNAGRFGTREFFQEKEPLSG